MGTPYILPIFICVFLISCGGGLHESSHTSALPAPQSLAEFMESELNPYFQGFDLTLEARGPLALPPEFQTEDDLQTLLGYRSIDLVVPNDLTASELNMITELIMMGRDSNPLMDALKSEPSEAQIGTKKIPLLPFLPEFARRYTGKFPEGPDFLGNCHNAVNQFYNDSLGFLTCDSFGETNPEHEHFDLIKPGQSLRFGDVMAIWPICSYAVFDVPLHTAIYLNRQFIWHKLDLGAQYPWSFLELASIVKHHFDIWKKSKKCRLSLSFYRHH